MLTAGEYVLYGGVGVCRITDFEKKSVESVDGTKTHEYCRLVPVFASNSVYYIPSAILESKVRGLLSKSQVMSIINNMPSTNSLKINDMKSKKSIFGSILRSGDYSQIVPMIKLLHDEKLQRMSNGKKLTFSDEKAMQDAEELLCQEFSMVLNIDKNDVPQYIENTLHSAV